MAGNLDVELFPDFCEVVAIPLHNQWVYLIQKNGSTSLRIAAERNNWSVLTNHDLADLDYVDIYIRNPRARYVSGVNTFLQHLARDHPKLDQDTAFWFAKRYKFLNTHYLPQIYWVQNLQRYLKPSAKLRFRNLITLNQLTDVKSRAAIQPPDQNFVSHLLQDDLAIEPYWLADKILLNLAGQCLTWAELLTHYRTKYPEIAQHVLSKA